MSNKILSNAIKLTVDKFQNTYDKNNEPYILHCLEVMNGVSDKGHYVMAAAVMHDLVEDTDVTLEDLKKTFPERVVSLVSLMTKDPNKTYDEYIERIMTDKDAIAIKMADLRHNSKIGRMPGYTEKDVRRLIKYHLTYDKLKKHIEKFI